MNQSWYSSLCSFIATISITVKLNQRLLRFFFTVSNWHVYHVHYHINKTNSYLIAIARWYAILSILDMTESQNRMENKLTNEIAQFHWKLYFIIVDLFCRYKSDNHMNIAYINCLQWCPQSLVRKILLDIIITPCAKISGFVGTSHLVWHSQPLWLIAT